MRPHRLWRLAFACLPVAASVFLHLTLMKPFGQTLGSNLPSGLNTEWQP